MDIVFAVLDPKCTQKWNGLERLQKYAQRISPERNEFIGIG
jgi:hypothetical protein